MPGLEDLLFLGAIGAAAYGAYQKFSGQTVQPVQQGGKIIKRTYTKPKSSVSLENTPISIGDVYGEIRPYDTENLLDRAPVPQINYEQYSNYPLLLEARIQEQQAVIGAPPQGSGILPPDEAYKLVQAGKYQASVKGRRISSLYYWSDVMVSDTISEGNRKKIPLAHYRNAAILADALDDVAVNYGGRVPINSWIRIQQKGSFHTDGRAADFGANYSVCKKGGKLFNAARKVSALKGIGYPNNGKHNSLHVDIGSGGGRGMGSHLLFIDNGYDGGGYEIARVL